MGINIGTVDDRSHEANFSSHCRGRDDLRESFGFAVSITPECFEAFTRRAEGRSSSDGRGGNSENILGRNIVDVCRHHLVAAQEPFC